MRRPWLALSLGSALLVAPTASAGVLVVDAANGPGTDFISLSAAIAAASSGDVLLVRSGTYAGNFVVAGKSLSIVADENAVVSLLSSGPVALPALELGSQGNQPFVVRGLQLGTSQPGAPALAVRGAATGSSHAFLEECTITNVADVALLMDNVSPATVSRCTLNGVDGSIASGLLGTPALVVEDGPLGTFGGFLQGGIGRDAGLLMGVSPVPGQDGSPGARVNAGDLTLKVFSGGIFVGGQGGDGAIGPGGCLAPGDGGDGILNAGAGPVFNAGSFGLGDLGGTAAPGCGPNGAQGDLLGKIPSSSLPVWLLGAVPGSVTLPRARREKQLVPITVQAPLEQSVSLLIGFAPTFTYVPLLNGVQVVAATSVVDLGQVPFTGTLSFQWRVPELGPGVESMFLYLQPVSTQANGVRTLGQPSVMLLLDGSL